MALGESSLDNSIAKGKSCINYVDQVATKTMSATQEVIL
ncbi:MAG: hypothetical protein KatS3mg079_224 [Caloramator sp.]|nr:MAG: hypothetical protein KatS3mg079_224 [Caloramator sp.]